MGVWNDEVVDAVTLKNSQEPPKLHWLKEQSPRFQSSLENMFVYNFGSLSQTG